ncbi:ComEC/Rec2 family competence protein [Actinomyces oris]|uniref:ComEC/Rec2 family competence protein n=1 Tax=Actinomyces oris TaxID=544580 RepID=A0A508BRD0_9ACTO|nr:ComEC/Rec2 family competence protein [Actinomyces oris]QQC40873.1 ComEC/Rec2 family competence protein [Actinomyces oris]TQD60732.1 ComEC/Rec2 family competence protein [Actinomyces oris]
MNEDHGGNGGGSPRAPWDDPALYAHLRQEQERNRYPDGGQHATSSKAPEALDLRLLAPVLACWAGAGWAVGREAADAWRQVLLLASGCTALAALLVVLVLRFRPPRHRADPRPGAPEHDPGAMGTLSASLLVCALCAATVLTISAVHLWARQRDPLTAAVATGQPVTLIGTVSQQPRVSATSRSTLVITTLDVEQVDTRASTLSATVLGDTQWLSLPMGTRVRVRTRLRPTEPGRAEAAIIPKRTGLTVLGPPSGILGAVTSVRAGLAQAVGAPGIGAPVAAGAGEETGLWPPGARSLVPGVALGDDHALPAPLREDMRTVSMTHLTAVSGQHVAIILGLGLEALGALPRRWRALLGAVMLTLLVILVRPSGSVLRAATMGAVMLLGVVAGRRAASVPALCAGAIVLLLIDPWQSRDYGFALSVAATAGIVIGSKPVAAHLSRRLPRWLATAVALPLVAQAACGPILILLQPSVGAWSVPANLLSEPAAVIATISGLLAALIAPAWPAAATVTAWPALAACSWMVLVAGFFAHLPGAALPWPGGLAGALALGACEIGVLILVAPRARRALLEKAGRLTRPARGRLAPWQRPAPPAPGARARHRLDCAGTRPSWRRSSSSAPARRSSPTER